MRFVQNQLHQPGVLYRDFHQWEKPYRHTWKSAIIFSVCLSEIANQLPECLEVLFHCPRVFWEGFPSLLNLSWKLSERRTVGQLHWLCATHAYVCQLESWSDCKSLFPLRSNREKLSDVTKRDMVNDNWSYHRPNCEHSLWNAYWVPF